jgi:hypothetical protein
MGFQEMILYERTFSLGKGLSFSRYIKNLDHESFPPYTLLISKTDDPDRCDIEIVMSDATMSANVMFMRGILFNKCIVQYFKSERVYTISASAGSGNVIMSSVYVIIAFLMFLLGFFILIIGEVPGQAFYPWAFTVVFIGPLISTYRLQKGLLDKIGFLGSDINEE